MGSTAIPLVLQIVDAVDRAPDATTAAAAIADLLRPRYDADRVSLRTRVIGESLLVVAAVWSRLPTMIPVGSRLSESASSWLEARRAGGPIVASETAESSVLLDDVLAGDGLRSWITIPLRSSEGEVRALLSVSSHAPGAFGEADVPFFATLGEGVSARLLDLLASDGAA